MNSEALPGLSFGPGQRSADHRASAPRSSREAGRIVRDLRRDTAGVYDNVPPAVPERRCRRMPPPGCPGGISPGKPIQSGALPGRQVPRRCPGRVTNIPTTSCHQTGPISPLVPSSRGPQPVSGVPPGAVAKLDARGGSALASPRRGPRATASANGGAALTPGLDARSARGGLAPLNGLQPRSIAKSSLPDAACSNSEISVLTRGGRASGVQQNVRPKDSARSSGGSAARAGNAPAGRGRRRCEEVAADRQHTRRARVPAKVNGPMLPPVGGIEHRRPRQGRRLYRDVRCTKWHVVRRAADGAKRTLPTPLCRDLRSRQPRRGRRRSACCVRLAAT